MKKTNLPNCITALRIVGTASLFFIEPFSGWFYFVYTVSGITDVLDGLIARLTHSVSEWGAKLDSIADLLFYAVMLTRVFPTLWERLPGGIWYAVGGIILLRLLAYGIAAVKYRRFASLHTYMNKLTGAVLFFVPYVLRGKAGVGFCIMVTVIAALSSLEELLIHLRAKEYHTNVKSITAKELYS